MEISVNEDPSKEYCNIPLVGPVPDLLYDKLNALKETLYPELALKANVANWFPLIAFAWLVDAQFTPPQALPAGEPDVPTPVPLVNPVDTVILVVVVVAVIGDVPYAVWPLTSQPTTVVCP